jgi:hypothetical protein
MVVDILSYLLAMGIGYGIAYVQHVHWRQK